MFSVEEVVRVLAQGVREELVSFDSEPVFVEVEASVVVLVDSPLAAECGGLLGPFSVDFSVAGV